MLTIFHAIPYSILCSFTPSTVCFFHLINCLSLLVQNSRHKTYGFDLMTEDDKVYYPLAADSQAEMDEWITILTRAIASEMEDTDGEGVCERKREKEGGIDTEGGEGRRRRGRKGVSEGKEGGESRSFCIPGST